MLAFSLLILLSTCLIISQAGTVLVDKDVRNQYLSQANSWFPSEESSISSKDLFHGPKNPYNFNTFDELTCDFVEPDPADPIGGTTPKFHCAFKLANGETKIFKVKYDQQYNPLLKWGRGNEEVYASIISQRILWALGFGSDQGVPVSVNCRNCPLEPWTYTQVIQGYDSEDLASGWMDARLIDSGEWNKKVPLLRLPAAMIYLKWDEFINGDAIEYYNPQNASQIETGYGWKELFTFPITNNDEQMIARNALSVIASFISHVDNFDGNQGFICLDTEDNIGAKAGYEIGKTKTSCKGQPFAYIHDVGGTLGYGWKLIHKNFWPNYMDLQQWSEAKVWGNLETCEVNVNGIPGCSWHGNLVVSEEGRAMAARLLSQLTDKQITDLFTAARANLMRGDSIDDWITGFKAKLQSDIFNVQCGK